MARTQTFDWLTTAILAALLLIVPIVIVLALNPGLLDELQREFAGPSSSGAVAQVATDTGASKASEASAADDARSREAFVGAPVDSGRSRENGASGDASLDTSVTSGASATGANDAGKSTLEKPVADDPVGDAEAGVAGPSSTAPSLAVPPEIAPALTDPDDDGDASGLQEIGGSGSPATPGPVAPTPAGPRPAAPPTEFDASPAPTSDALVDAAVAAAAAESSEVEEQILSEIRSLVTSQRSLESQFAALREEIDGRFSALKSVVADASGDPPAAASVKTSDDARAERAAKVLRATLEGRLVLALGDDAGSTIEFVYVPPGRFRMGRTPVQERSAVTGTIGAPAQEVVVDRGFFVSRTEITDGQYAAFLRANYGDDPKLDAVLKARSDARKPAAKVDWPFAKFFCLWLADESGFDVRLPTEVEWEYVARGPQGALRLDDDRAEGIASRENIAPRDDAVRNVDADVVDRSWCGAVDLWGNVAEWCADAYDAEAFSSAPNGAAQVYVPAAAPADWSETDAEMRSVRGGSFADAPETRDPSERRRAAPDTAAPSVGFRVVLIPDFDGEPEVGVMP